MYITGFLIIIIQYRCIGHINYSHRLRSLVYCYFLTFVCVWIWICIVFCCLRCRNICWVVLCT